MAGWREGSTERAAARSGVRALPGEWSREEERVSVRTGIRSRTRVGPDLGRGRGRADRSDRHHGRGRARIEATEHHVVAGGGTSGGGGPEETIAVPIVAARGGSDLSDRRHDRGRRGTIRSQRAPSRSGPRASSGPTWKFGMQGIGHGTMNINRPARACAIRHSDSRSEIRSR